MRATRVGKDAVRILGVSRWQDRRGETPQQALQREIEEELLCEINVDKEVCTSDYLYDFRHVELTTFLCHLIEGSPKLTEHARMVWVEPADMPQLNWAPVDHDAVEHISKMTI